MTFCAKLGVIDAMTPPVLSPIATCLVDFSPPGHNGDSSNTIGSGFVFQQGSVLLYFSCMCLKKHAAASLQASALQSYQRDKNAKEMCLEWGWGFCSVGEHLPSKHRALGTVLSSRKKKKKCVWSSDQFMPEGGASQSCKLISPLPAVSFWFLY